MRLLGVAERVSTVSLFNSSSRCCAIKALDGAILPMVSQALSSELLHELSASESAFYRRCNTLHAGDRSSAHAITAESSSYLLDRVAASPGVKSWAALSFGQTRCSLPKCQSRVRRLPTTASVGYSPSRNPSAAWPRSIRRPPYFFFHSGVRLLRHTDLLDRLGDGLASCHGDFNTRSLGMICSACSFFPRGIECPLLVITPADSLAGSGALKRGQVTWLHGCVCILSRLR